MRMTRARSARLAAGVTVAEAARAAGLRPSSYLKVELGRGATEEVARRLARRLGCRMEIYLGERSPAQHYEGAGTARQGRGRGGGEALGSARLP